MHCVMKISVIISVALVTQVSASFFDVFQGAVLSVQTSFGKLLSDVVTDVKVTVDCTILAVEHVLSLSDDATDRYYEKCKGKEGTESNTASNHNGENNRVTTTPPKLEISVEISNEDLKKNLPGEINAKVNETLSKILDDYNIKSRLESVEDVLAKETERLADVGVLVKDELDKLSSEVNSDIRRIEQNDSPPLSVDTVLDKIKLLQDMEQNDKNSSEAKEIHQVIDKVLDKLDVIEDTDASENVRLEEILTDMESHSNNSFLDLEKQFAEWKEEKSKYLDDIKGKMEEEEKIAKHLSFEDTSNRLSDDRSNSTNEVKSNNTNTDNNLEIILLPSIKEFPRNATDFSLLVTTNNTLNISTALPSTNKPIFELSVATYPPNNQINNTGQTEPSNLDVQTSLISSNLSTSTDNLTTSTKSETIEITTDFISPGLVFDQSKTNFTNTNESTTLTDHFTGTKPNETISTNVFSNYSNKEYLTIPAATEYFNESAVINSTSGTISTNILLNYSDVAHQIVPVDNENYNESIIMNSTNETIPTHIYLNFSNKSQPIIHVNSEQHNESAVMNSTTETGNIFLNDSQEAQLIIPTNSDDHNESTIMDLTVTTYEPFVPHTVLDEYYQKDPKSSDENRPVDLDNLLTTSESAVVPTVIHEDSETIIKPSYDLNSTRIVAVSPLIDVGTKPIASNVRISTILKTKDDEYHINKAINSYDSIGSTTEANKESLVLTTNKPTHDNDKQVNMNDKTSLDYDAFFRSKTKNSSTHWKAVKDARKLIEDSKKTDIIMNSILKYKKAGRSIFNYPALANFGK